MKVTISITGIQSALDKVMALSHPKKCTQAHRIAGQALRDYIAGWYREKGEEHWQNPSLPTHGPGRRSTRWAAKHLFGWRLIEATANSVTVGTPDEDGSLRHKIYGGTITAKKARALTIPVIPKAHGKRVADYESETGKQLFPLRQSLLNIRNQHKGTDFGTGYLFEKFGRGGIRAVYALKKSIKQAPWPDAMPKNDDMKRVFRDSLLNFFITDMNGQK